MNIGPDNLGNGSATTQERYSGPVGGYRAGRRDGGLSGESGDADLMPRNGGAPNLDADADLDHVRSLPSLDLNGLSEPVYAPPTNWLDSGGSLADHPLLRGLLLELPPKGSVPPPGWLDRWFEAARCILELLYLQESRSH
jgi:hypothetical protein